MRTPARSFREFAAERFTRSPRTQKRFCRAFQELLIGIKHIILFLRFSHEKLEFVSLGLIGLICLIIFSALRRHLKKSQDGQT